MQYNFIRTQDIKVSNILKNLGFKLVDSNNGFYTFVNDSTIRFSNDVDTTKIHYTNMLFI